MNDIKLQEHLFKLHKQSVTESAILLNFNKIPKPINLIIRIPPLPSFEPGKYGNLEESMILIPGISPFSYSIYSEIARAELECLHETGHYLNFFHNSKTLNEWNYVCKLNRNKNSKSERIVGFQEVVAEYFSLFYIDHLEGIDSFIYGRGHSFQPKPNKREFYSEVLKVFLSTPIEKRRSTCEFLIKNSYQEARTSFAFCPVLNQFEKIINDSTYNIK